MINTVLKHCFTMNTFAAIFFFASVFVCTVHSQMLGDPGTEPWVFASMVACQTKNVQIQKAQMTAQQCTAALSANGNPIAICSKQKDRNNCLKPFYDELKKCFDSDDHKKQVEKAYEAQKAGVKFFCKDDAKMFKSMTQEDQACAGKMQDPKIGECTKKVMTKNMPDMSQLFSSSNCKIMQGNMDCQKKAMKSCKTTKFADFMLGQYNAIMDKTPCSMDSGASSFASIFVTPLLIACLLSHGLFKALF